MAATKADFTTYSQQYVQGAIDAHQQKRAWIYVLICALNHAQSVNFKATIGSSLIPTAVAVCGEFSDEQLLAARAGIFDLYAGTGVDNPGTINAIMAATTDLQNADDHLLNVLETYLVYRFLIS